jgi:hypothetical protein
VAFGAVLAGFTLAMSSARAAPPAEASQVEERWEASAILAALRAPPDTPLAPQLVWEDAPFPPSPRRLPPPSEGRGTEECQLAAVVDPTGAVRRAVVVACPGRFARAILPTLRRWRAATEPVRGGDVVWVGRLTFVLRRPPPR